MKIDPNKYRAQPGAKIRLEDWPTLVKPAYRSKEEYQTLLADHVARMSSLQQRLYASNQYALLILFQAMDAAGKDGAIRHVMSGVNPQGCQVFSFKQPSATELQHDFLWRSNRDLPGRGNIGIFNRSYYEEVLVVRVHPEILKGEGFDPGAKPGGGFWKERFRSINDLEAHLYGNHTRIIKFFLHLSKEEQRKRFLQRLDDPQKNWKFSASDLAERSFWDDYMHAYERCISATSTAKAPWYVVPADDKENARLIVSRTIVDTLEALKLNYPKTDAAHEKDLDQARRSLLAEK